MYWKVFFFIIIHRNTEISFHLAQKFKLKTNNQLSKFMYFVLVD